MTVRQWVAHAGLDPRAHQSGSSVDKPARISRVGNVHMRRVLYMPALVAVQHNRLSGERSTDRREGDVRPLQRHVRPHRISIPDT